MSDPSRATIRALLPVGINGKTIRKVLEPYLVPLTEDDIEQAQARYEHIHDEYLDYDDAEIGATLNQILNVFLDDEHVPYWGPSKRKPGLFVLDVEFEDGCLLSNVAGNDNWFHFSYNPERMYEVLAQLMEALAGTSHIATPEWANCGVHVYLATQRENRACGQLAARDRAFLDEQHSGWYNCWSDAELGSDEAELRLEALLDFFLPQAVSWSKESANSLNLSLDNELNGKTTSVRVDRSPDTTTDNIRFGLQEIDAMTPLLRNRFRALI